MKAIFHLRAALAAIVTLGLTATADAQLNNRAAHFMIGGGYLEEPEKPYLFAQLGWTPYEDAQFAHTVFLEGLFHWDDSQLDFLGPGGVVLFSEDADITFSNITVNYELELKITEPVSLYAGAGAGAELITINDRFDDALDKDINFVAQVFAGVRVRLGRADATVGVRRIFREDFSLLNDQFITNDTWAFEAGIGFRF